MVLKRFAVCASWLVALAIAGCTITTGSSTTCVADSTVSCVSGAIGYSCSGSDTPPQNDFTLVCSSATAGNAGAMLYCCFSNGAGVVGDGGTGSEVSEASSPSDGGPTGDESVDGSPAVDETVDGGPTVDGATAPETGTDAGGTCSVVAATGNASCDACVTSACCSALTACETPDDAGVDDAGLSACEQLIECTVDCIRGNPDAGSPPDTLANCTPLCAPSYSATAQQNAIGLLLCEQANCTQQCK